MAMKAEKGRVSIMTKQQKKTLNLVLTYLVIVLIFVGIVACLGFLLWAMLF